jgi:hypothetical protein
MAQDTVKITVEKQRKIQKEQDGRDRKKAKAKSKTGEESGRGADGKAQHLKKPGLEANLIR